MTDQAIRSTVSTEGTRVRISTPASFDEVREKLLGQMGTVTVPEITALAAQVKSPNEFDEIVTDRWVGPSGFMLFATINHGDWIPLYGAHRRSERWILGNPLIAITMILHDVSAGLFAPVELLITEHADGQGCSVDYVLPSSMIAPTGASDALRSAAVALDEKFEALVSKATGLE